ncbi:MAG TPA: biotin/lipoyl-containing protein, partial [Casimicrobiaceae bacterium]|nr:biotin/lipoyl-containing protein [Casimicrobiaceae bacterium]
MRVEVKVPQLPESVSEATLVSWHKQPGEAVKRDENLIDVETDKVVLELPSPAAGVLVEVLKADGATVAGKEVIAVIDSDATAAMAAAAVAQPAAVAPTPMAAAAASATSVAAASPSARKIMTEQGMSAADVQGTGRGGRVTKGDVLGAASAPMPTPAKPAVATAPVVPAPTRPAPTAPARPAARGQRPEQRVPMSRLRQRVAERLV